jgi:predicted dehydrogenase
MVAERAVLPAITRSDAAELVAICSVGGPAPEAWSTRAVESYDAVIQHRGVEAVYIPLPNHLHAHWTERAAAAGKHVLCEKPLAPDPATAERMARSCREAGVVLAEAWMTPFDARWSTTIELARSGLIGEVDRVDASFTFTIGPDHDLNYRWMPEHGGGALLDVGIYCLGPAVELWGPHPGRIDVDEIRWRHGVDAAVSATLAWESGRRCTIRCSFIDDEAQTLTIRGSQGTLQLASEAHTGGALAEVILHRHVDVIDTIRVVPSDPYQTMIETYARAIRGAGEWPRPAERSLEMIRLLDRIKGEWHT